MFYSTDGGNGTVAAAGGAAGQQRSESGDADGLKGKLGGGGAWTDNDETKAARVPRAIWPICHERRTVIHLRRSRVPYPDIRTFVCFYTLFLL